MTACEQKTANLHSIETFGSVDGPGVRFVVFLQGCGMRCRFCHNPDTWSTKTNQTITADALLEKALRYRRYWGKSGGITVSGGEPLLQMDFLLSFFAMAKAQGVHTVIDTAGAPFSRDPAFLDKFRQLMEYTDLVLLDIKEIDPDKHKRLTGQDNANILDLARYLSDTGKPVWIRHVLVPSYSDFDEDLIHLGAFIKTLQNVQRVEVLPYHTMGIFKWNKLGIPYPLEGIDPPTPDRVENASRLLCTQDYLQI